MTQATTDADASTGPVRRLTGRLGVGAIVFMVIAAAAPLTVIGGNVPLAVGGGNGIGAPVGFLIAASVLLVFAIGFVTMTPHVREAGAFFSYVTTGLGSRAGLGRRLRGARRVHGHPGRRVRLHGLGRQRPRDLLRRPRHPLVGLLLRHPRRRRGARLPPHRAQRPRARRRARRRDRDHGRARRRDLRHRRRGGPGLVQLLPRERPAARSRRRGAVRADRVHRLRGDGRVPGRGARPRADDPARDLPGRGDHRRLLRPVLLGAGHRGGRVRRGRAWRSGPSTARAT